MSVKHIRKYYEEVCAQYEDMLSELKDFEQLCMEGMVQPEIIDQAKSMLAPIKDNWMKLNYIMFLLDKPNRKCKEKTYKNQNKKYLKEHISKEQVILENDKCIENIKEIKKEL